MVWSRRPLWRDKGYDGTGGFVMKGSLFHFFLFLFTLLFIFLPIAYSLNMTGFFT